MDTLSAILDAVRLSTGLISRAHFQAPWAVHTSGASGAIFHTLVSGRCWIKPDAAGTAIRLEAGDVVVVSRGDPHVMCDDPGTRPVPIASVPTLFEGAGVPTVHHGGKGEETRILCGTFRLEHGTGESLLQQLPPIVHVPRAEHAMTGWVATAVQWMDQELERGAPGAETVVGRLTDVLFVQVLRQLATTQPESLRGWLAATRDEHIGRAVALIHEEPGASWNAELLASRVGMSRSRFFERFTELIGEPPAKYLAGCRIRAAAELLRGKDWSTAELASRVGYASEDGFTRMFKRRVGVSPREFRRRVEQRAG